MKILITGGHFSPAYAIIKKLMQEGNEVAIAGRRFPLEGETTESFEYLVSKKVGIPFFEVRTGRIQRKFTKHTIPSLLKTSVGFYDSFLILSKFRPDVVLTFGGYIGFPVSYVSYLKKIPVILHEQTLGAGIANRAIGKIAQKICISYDSSQKYFPPKKTVLTGNPLREEIFSSNNKLDPQDKNKVVYVTGGSLGAHSLNEIIKEKLEEFLSDFVLIHQTGDNNFNDYEELEKKFKNLPENLKKRYILRKFIYPDEIGNVYKISDIVVARSGINTVNELLALGKVSLLIPLSHGQTNEQLENAKLIKEVGLGDFIEEDKADANTVYLKIKEMIEEKEKFEKNKKNAQSLIVKDAAQKIINVIKEGYEKKSS